MKTAGYFAIDRRIFDNPLLRHHEWFWAWQWLIGNAAWKPDGKRLRHGFAEMKRGQIAVTTRELAMAWGWSKSNVTYFLDKLEAEKMIVREVIRTKSQSKNGPKSSYSATILTICNYDKFQKSIKATWSGTARSSARSFAQSLPQLPGMTNELNDNHLKQFNHKTQEAGEKGLRQKPRHLAITPDGKRVWCDHGSSEWHAYNTDYISVHGVSCPVKLYIGGPGNWFYKAGAALEPKKKKAYG